MSLLYKEKKDLKYSVSIFTLPNGNLSLSFSADCGKFGSDEDLDEHEISVKDLLDILQQHYSSL